MTELPRDVLPKLHYASLSGISSNFSFSLITFIFITNFIDFSSFIIFFLHFRRRLTRVVVNIARSDVDGIFFFFRFHRTRPEGKTRKVHSHLIVIVCVRVSDGKVNWKENQDYNWVWRLFPLCVSFSTSSAIKFECEQMKLSKDSLASFFLLLLLLNSVEEKTIFIFMFWLFFPTSKQKIFRFTGNRIAQGHIFCSIDFGRDNRSIKRKPGEIKINYIYIQRRARRRRWKMRKAFLHFR